LSAPAVGAALWWMTPYEPWHAALIAVPRPCSST